MFAEIMKVLFIMLATIEALVIPDWTRTLSLLTPMTYYTGNDYVLNAVVKTTFDD